MTDFKAAAIRRQAEGFGRVLYLFAAFTLIIKYLIPVLWAVYRLEFPTRYIFFWDAWWIIHLWVGHGLLNAKKIWLPALVLAVAEIIIITIKFSIFFKTPIWDFWHASWLVNKTALLIYFWILLFWLLRAEVKKSYG